MPTTSWEIEFGQPTEAQVKRFGDKVICNFNIILRLNGIAVGNMSGFQIRKGARTPFIAAPDTRIGPRRWLKFAGFGKRITGKIVARALQLQEENKLLPKYSVRFNLRRPISLRGKESKSASSAVSSAASK